MDTTLASPRMFESSKHYCSPAGAAMRTCTRILWSVHRLVPVIHEWSLTPGVQDFIPVVDSISKKVIHIDFPPRYKPKTSESLFDGTGLEIVLTQATTAPPALEDDTFAAANRNRIPPPQKSYDFLPDLLSQNENFKFRDDIKPLHILQPEGVSFKVDGHVIEWQKWKMHVGEWTGVFHLANVSFTSSVPPSRGYRTVYHHLQRRWRHSTYLLPLVSLGDGSSLRSTRAPAPSEACLRRVSDSVLANHE